MNCKICNKKIYCKELCHRCYFKDYKKRNEERLNKYLKAYYQKNLEKFSKNSKIYYSKNHKKISDYYKIWRIYNKSKLNKYWKDWDKVRYKNNLNYKLRKDISVNLQHRIKNNLGIKKYKFIELLGCSFQEFKQYIEKQFKSGMSWENYGKEWHLDHIIPIAYFILIEKEQQKLCFHYSNYQPLWAKENLSKGCKII